MEDGSELVEWMAFEGINGPLPDVRSDYHDAHLVATMANLHGRDPKEHPEPYPVDQFLLFKTQQSTTPAAPQSPEDAKRYFMAIAGGPRKTPPKDLPPPKPRAPRRAVTRTDR